MKSSLTFLLLPTLAVGIFATLGGCAGDGGYAASGTVYGGFGYDGPVEYDAPGYVEGGVYAHPPFGGNDRRDDHADDRSRPAPAARAPSIPNTPRPAASRAAPSRSSGGGDRERH